MYLNIINNNFQITNIVIVAKVKEDMSDKNNPMLSIFLRPK